VKKLLIKIGVVVCLVCISALLEGCTQATNNAVVYAGRGSAGVSGIPSDTNFGGHPCVKGRGVPLVELQKQLTAEYSVVQSDKWAGQTFYQEVGAGSGNAHTITFVMSAGRRVFIDNGSGTPSYLYDCCNRIWPVTAVVQNEERAGGGVVVNQTINQSPTFLNSFGQGLGGGLGVALGVGLTECRENASTWYQRRDYYQPQTYYQQRYYQPRRHQYYQPRREYYRRDCQQYQRPSYQSPQREVYCPPPRASDSVGRGGSSRVFYGEHNRSRDPNGAR